MQTSNPIAIVTDSTCDIPDDLIHEYEITVLPAYVIWGEEQFRDRIDLQADAFYRRLVKDPIYPSSAHPTPETFRRTYETLQNGGAEAVIVVTVSSALSGTYNAASQAATASGVPVHVIDAKGPSMSSGWQVLAAARARDAGGDVDAVIAAAETARSCMAQLVYLNSIEYLHKGGRIGNAAKLIGMALRIKPIVYIDHETGIVEIEKAARTFKHAMRALYEGFFERLDTSKPLHIAVMHGGVPEKAEALADRIREAYHPEELLIHITGPVLGINTGPGALALAGYNEA
jgi:DegV family protein with EDD domain